MNIAVVIADDLGTYDLGCMAHPSIRTPHLDAMARALPAGAAAAAAQIRYRSFVIRRRLYRISLIDRLWKSGVSRLSVAY